MEATFKIWETSRNIYLKIIENYSLEQLNTIPEGMSNNLIWNMGHVIVSQQKLVYALSGLPMHISDSLFEKYQNLTIYLKVILISAKKNTLSKELVIFFIKYVLCKFSDNWEFYLVYLSNNRPILPNSGVFPKRIG